MFGALAPGLRRISQPCSASERCRTLSDGLQRGREVAQAAAGTRVAAARRALRSRRRRGGGLRRGSGRARRENHPPSRRAAVVPRLVNLAAGGLCLRYRAAMPHVRKRHIRSSSISSSSNSGRHYRKIMKTVKTRRLRTSSPSMDCAAARFTLAIKSVCTPSGDSCSAQHSVVRGL